MPAASVDYLIDATAGRLLHGDAQRCGAGLSGQPPRLVRCGLGDCGLGIDAGSILILMRSGWSQLALHRGPDRLCRLHGLELSDRQPQRARGAGRQHRLVQRAPVAFVIIFAWVYARANEPPAASCADQSRGPSRDRASITRWAKARRVVGRHGRQMIDQCVFDPLGKL